MSTRRLTLGSVTTALFAAVLTLVAPAAPAGAAPGDLDTTFGTGGTVSPIAGLADSVVEAPDGKIVVSSADFGDPTSTIYLRRYTSTGAADNTFSGDGLITISTPRSPGTMVHVDSLGRTILVAGYLGGGNPRYQIWRFTSTGAADVAFSGDGTATFDGPAAGFSLVSGIGVQPDGDIIVGINDTFPVGGLSQFPQLVRLTSAGSVAQTVDVLADYTESRRGGGTVATVDGSGRPYVLVPDDGKLNLRRYTESLAVDTSYSGDGLVAVGRPGGGTDNENWGSGLTVTSGGVAAVTGTVGRFVDNGAAPPTITQTGLLLARLTTTGALDTAFSADGITSLPIPTAGSPFSTEPNAVTMGADGSLVVVGTQDFEGGADSNTVAWQVRADGNAETGFSGDGRVERTGFSVAATAAAASARLLVFGYGDSGSSLTAITLFKTPGPTAPAAPAKPTAAAGDGQATVSWTAPATGGSAITGYVVTPYIGAAAQTPKNVGASPTSTTVTGLTNGTAYTFKVAAKNSIGTGAQSVASDPVTPAPVPVPVGATYVAVQPCRVLDTRFGGGGRLASLDQRSYRIGGYDGATAGQGGAAGSCGVPDGVVAVEASVSAVSPTNGGYFRAWPAGTAEPNATFMNFTAGQGITNTGTIALAPTGALDLTVKSYGGPSHYVIDVQGYFVTGLSPASPRAVVGSVYVPVQPCRVLDTRFGGGGKLQSLDVRSYRVGGYDGATAGQGGATGSCGVPDGADAVKASVSAVSPTNGGYFRAWPAGAPEPNATFINFTKNQGVTNTGAISLAPTGALDLTVKNFGGPSHYVIDVQGYFVAPGLVPPGENGAFYVAVQPCRVLDTRFGGGGKLQSLDVRSYRVGGYDGSTAGQGGAAGSCGVPDGAAAVEASVSAVSPANSGYFRAWPAGATEPNATFINFTKNQGITNTGALSLAPAGAQDLTLKNYGGPSHYVIDVQGYYASESA